VSAAEEPWPWILLVETSGVGFATTIRDRYLKAVDLAAHGAAPDTLLVTHRLQLSMDEA
jgi:hypothetical protein